MLKMLRPEIALNVAGGINKPQTAEELFSSALSTEHYLNNIDQQKKARSEGKSQAQLGDQKTQSTGEGNYNGKRKRWNNSKDGPVNKQPKYTSCAKCGGSHSGECLQGTNKCFTCGVEGHKARACPNKFQAPPQQQMQSQNAPAQLHYMQSTLEGPHIGQGRLEAPPVATNARVFSLTKEDVANASTVVTGGNGGCLAQSDRLELSQKAVALLLERAEGCCRGVEGEAAAGWGVRCCCVSGCSVRGGL
ncbi:uncharacterized protein LOC141812357 [Curcuma longa]|uniref:uncharacterized protein LOC141812357 n=1 Tax=Curcuma longa TaxID=136217 RepID=UPI003D9F50C0